MKAIIAILFAMLLSGCYSNTTPPGSESVIVDNPWVLGHGGVRAETQKTGLSWYWITSRTIEVPLTPVKYDEPLDHMPTNDNNFINYASYFVLQWSDPVYNVINYGEKGWYEHNLKEQYRTIVRDVTKQYPMTDIMIKPAVLKAIEDEITARFKALIKESGLHVALLNVNMGKVLPDRPVIEEMNNTAVQQQRIKTEQQRKRAEDSRKEAEQSRAAADNAYRESMHLDTAQFVALEGIKRYAEACASSHATCIIGSVPVVVGK